MLMSMLHVGDFFRMVFAFPIFGIKKKLFDGSLFGILVCVHLL